MGFSRAILALVVTAAVGAGGWDVTALNAWAEGADVVVALSLAGRVGEGSSPPVVEPLDDGWLLPGVGLDAPRRIDGPLPLRRAEVVEAEGGVALRLWAADGLERAAEPLWSPTPMAGLLLWRLRGEARPSTAELDLSLRRIVLDPGHGGRWTGAGGVKSGVFEKELVLEIALELAALLEEGLGVEVLLTRYADYDVGLRARSRLSNETAADLFISVHLNGGPPSHHGSEVYRPEYKRPDAPWYAGHAFELPLTGDLPWHLRLEAVGLAAQLHAEAVCASDYELADTIQRAHVELLGLADRGVKSAPFFVIVETDAPAVLTESAFLSNPDEDALLQDPDFRARIARAIYRGVVEFIEDQDRVIFRREVTADALP